MAEAMLGFNERLSGTSDFSQQSPLLTKVIAIQDSFCSHFSEHSSAVAARRGLGLKLNPWSLIPSSIGPMRRVGTFRVEGGVVVLEVDWSCEKIDRSLSTLEITAVPSTPIRPMTAVMMATLELTIPFTEVWPLIRRLGITTMPTAP